MILRFTGGFKPESRSLSGGKPIKYIDNASAVCFFVPAGVPHSPTVKTGDRVLVGDRIAVVDKTPVHASVSGEFRGLMEIAGDNYYVVVSDNKNQPRDDMRPEERALTHISGDDLITAVQRLGIVDSRSGRPLWKMMEDIKGHCTRVMIDCTDSCPESAIAYRICIEKAEEIIGGAKILLHALNSAKGVIAIEEYRHNAAAALADRVADPMLFAFAFIEEKQPYTDRTLMEAVYLAELTGTQTPSDRGCLIVGAETAAILFDCISTGMPQTRQFVSLCGNGADDQNLCIPCGMMTKDVIESCGGLDDGAQIAENNLLLGRPAGGTVKADTRTLISYFPKKFRRLPCIGCGECAKVCTARINPKQILSKSKKERTFVAAHCLECRCCEYVCPCNIPLFSLICRERKKDRKESKK